MKLTYFRHIILWLVLTVQISPLRLPLRVLLSFSANKAVAIQAAIDLAVGLPQRIAQKSDAEKASFQRATKFGPLQISSAAPRRAGRSFSTILPTTATLWLGQPISQSLVGLTPFTGA
jgi:hypothetical protein